MVVQNLHLTKLNGALHSKEKQRASNRTLVIDSSKGQVFSSTEILEGLRNQELRKEEEAAQKKVRANARATKKEGLARMEVEWLKIKAQNDKNTDEWKLTCENLQNEGIPKKHWPKPPTRQRKPTLPDILAAMVDEDDEGEDRIDED